MARPIIYTTTVSVTRDGDIIVRGDGTNAHGRLFPMCVNMDIEYEYVIYECCMLMLSLDDMLHSVRSPDESRNIILYDDDCPHCGRRLVGINE